MSALTIPLRFDQQMRAHGGRLAIQSDAAALTYLDVDRAATQLAHRILQRRGKASESITLLFDHGAEIAVAMLAVLKAGKVVVVLDPRAPHERSAFVIDHAQSALIVADQSNLALARELASGAIDVLPFEDAGTQIVDTDLGVEIAPDDLAIVIYTSGSTGQPKGVMHTHRNILSDVSHVTGELGITHEDRWIWHTAVGFAGSARTILGALLTGSTLYPFDAKRRGFPELAAWLRQHAITVFRSVPTTFRSFMATLREDARFPSVRVVSMGGEPLFRADVDSFNRHFPPHAVLVHPFGPTECMLVCWNVIRHGQSMDGDKVPIGRPLPDTSVLLLDDDRQPVIDGQIGEIAVKSPVLSPGYWQDPEQTAAVFVRDRQGERMYLTGDLGTRGGDGVLTHVGRRDFQVKIRGYRIEVSEIEAALRRIDGISDAVVVGRPSTAGDMRLVAYIVPAASAIPTIAQLRAALGQTLPDYMMPAAFVALESLPQTATGKADRRRVPAVDDRRPELATAFTLPRTPMETALLEMWNTALGITWLGMHDNFFEVGGDSLIAMRLIAQIKTMLGVEVPLAEMLDNATVATTAAAIARRSPHGT